MTAKSSMQPEVYQGQFGEFTITQSDRVGVMIYRAGLIVAAFSLAFASFTIFSQGVTPTILQSLTILYAVFSLALGISLLTIHIYLIPLHRLLQLFWLIGTISAIIFAWQNNTPLALFVYEHPLSLLGVGFTFAALTGIYFKEAFCFNRLETKVLTPLVPFLLLGHLAGLLPPGAEQILLLIWGILFAIFALRKITQPIPSDIGDKSVFDYLKQQRFTQA